MSWFDFLKKPFRRKEVPAEEAAVEQEPVSPFAHLHPPEPPMQIQADAEPAAPASEIDYFVFSKSALPRATVGVYYPESGVFLIRHSDKNKTGFLCQAGVFKASLHPLCGDWNGDGLDGIGLYESETALFMLRNSLRQDGFDMVFSFGPAGRGWLPVVGDWDGDGTQSVGVYDPVDSAFFLSDSFDGGDASHSFRFGPPGAGWLPIAGDWNGDGRQTIGLYDPADGYFYLRNDNADGEADTVFHFKPVNRLLLPIVGDWNECGRQSVGLYDRETSTFFLRESESAPVVSFQFGTRSPTSWPISLLWRP